MQPHGDINEDGGGVGARSGSILRNGSVMVPLTAGICLVLLTVVLKNVLLVPAQQLTSDIILYIIIYTGFIVSFPLQDDGDAGSSRRMLLWIGMIIAVTVGIILVYAL